MLGQWRCSACAAAVLTAIALIQPVPAATTPESDPALSYSQMLSRYPNNDNLRLASAGEMRAFPGVYPMTPPEKNGSFHFVNAAALISDSTPPPGSALSDRPYKGDRRALEQWVTRNAAALGGLRTGAAMAECSFPVMFYKDSGLPAGPEIIMPQMLRLARLATDAGFLAELKGDAEGARQWYLTITRMGLLMRHGSESESITGITIMEVGAVQLARLVANADLRRGELDAMVNTLRNQEVTPEELRGLLADEVLSALVRAQKEKLSTNMGAPFDSEEYRREAARVQLTFNDSWFSLLGAGKLNAVLGQLARAQVAVNADPDERFLEWRVKLAQTDLLMRVEQTRAAMDVFLRNTHQLPEKLDELVPAYLPQVPLDPFSGTPLRYAQTEKGWKLWSVGYDRKDDGGITGDPGTLWVGPDFVFFSDLPSNLQYRSRGAVSGPAT